MHKNISDLQSNYNTFRVQISIEMQVIYDYEGACILLRVILIFPAPNFQ